MHRKGMDCYQQVINYMEIYPDKIKQEFFQVVAMSELLYSCTTRILTKHLEKKLDENYTRMLHGVLDKSWKQQATKQQLYSHLPPIS